MNRKALPQNNKSADILYLTIVTVPAFTFFSFIGIFGSAYPKATNHTPYDFPVLQVK